MRERWRHLGVGDEAIAVPGATPGIYLIATDDDGERTFTYWRSQSAASRLFTRVDWMEQLGADYLYLSGVSLQLMPLPVRIALIERLRTLREQGTKVVFDSNYRPSGWPDVTAASAAMSSVLRECDLALVTLEDEIALGECHDASSCAAHLAALGVPEIVVKLGADGALVRTEAAGSMHVRTTPGSPWTPPEPVTASTAPISSRGSAATPRWRRRTWPTASRATSSPAGSHSRHRAADASWAGSLGGTQAVQPWLR